MHTVKTNQVLNRLYTIHNRSLPMYLSYARPWPLRGDEQAKETLERIVAGQRAMVERIGAMILETDGELRSGEFPTLFTAYNDLTYEFLVRSMVEHLKQDITAIEACVAQLSLAPRAKALAQEALGAAKGHLDSLMELTRQPTRPGRP